METNSLDEQEVALRVVEIYFEQIARRGIKRSLDFDSLINTYFYVLEKLKKQDELLLAMRGRVAAEEKAILKQSKEEVIPSIEALKEKIPKHD